MSFFRKQAAKLTIALARSTVSIAIDNASLALKKGRYEDAIKEMQAVHISGKNILDNVGYLEGFEGCSEQIAFKIIEANLKYHKEHEVLKKALIFMAELDQLTSHFEDII